MRVYFRRFFLKHDEHLLAGEYLDMLYSNNFLPIITEPSRLTHHTSTLIDHIYRNPILGLLWLTSQQPRSQGLSSSFPWSGRDQPELGSFFPRSLWDGEMKDTGNEVGACYDNNLDGCCVPGIRVA